MEELKCLQLLCKFEITAIAETHLDKTVPDSVLDINGINVLRVDRKGERAVAVTYTLQNIYKQLNERIYILIALKESGYKSNFRALRLCSQ